MGVSRRERVLRELERKNRDEKKERRKKEGKKKRRKKRREGPDWGTLRRRN